MLERHSYVNKKSISARPFAGHAGRNPAQPAALPMPPERRGKPKKFSKRNFETGTEGRDCGWGSMETKTFVLINSRFEAMNFNDRIVVFDLDKKNPAETTIDGVGVNIVLLDSPKPDLEAGLLALAWLRDHQRISPGEYLHYADTFLASHPVQVRPS
jgi:hypothetical protein